MDLAIQPESNKIVGFAFRPLVLPLSGQQIEPVEPGDAPYT